MAESLCPRALAFLPLRPDSELPRRFLPLVGGSNALVHCCRTCTTRRLSARVAEGYAHSCATMVCCSSASRRSRRSAREGGEGLRFASAAARFIPQQQGDACAERLGRYPCLMLLFYGTGNQAYSDSPVKRVRGGEGGGEREGERDV